MGGYMASKRKCLTVGGRNDAGTMKAGSAVRKKGDWNDTRRGTKKSGR